MGTSKPPESYPEENDKEEYLKSYFKCSDTLLYKVINGCNYVQHEHLLDKDYSTLLLSFTWKLLYARIIAAAVCFMPTPAYFSRFF